MKINYKNYQNEIVKIRRHLHMYPETAFKGFKTTKFIKNYLEEIGYNVEATGLTGCSTFLCVNKEFPTVVLRAEMDAVPIAEESGEEFSSKIPNAMHACGHDANMAVSLVLAKLAMKTKDQLSCNIRFVFEPAEEIGMGAAEMIKSGVLENPKADAFIMIHFACKSSGGVEVNESVATAAIGRLEISIKGISAHWAAAQKGKNAITAASKLICRIEDINKTYTSPYPFIIGIGKISGGSSANIVPDSALLNGNIRACTMEDYNNICSLIQKAADDISESTGTKIEVSLSENPITPIINDPFLVKKAADVGKKVYGESFYLTNKLYLAGDNACLYFDKTRGIFMVFRSPMPNGSVSLHNPKFRLNEEEFYKSLEMLHTYLKELYRP